MNGLHKTVVAILALSIAVVAAAGSASAISVTNEDENPPQGVACGAVTVNSHSVTQNGERCVLHAIQREPIDLEILGATVSTCNSEFSIAIGSNGLGAIFRQTLSDVTPGSCPTPPCNEAGANKPWPVVSQTEGIQDNWTMRVTFCYVLPFGGTINCTFDMPYIVIGHSQVSYGSTGQEYTCVGGAAQQIHGSWTTEDVGDDDIEIRH